MKKQIVIFILILTILPILANAANVEVKAEPANYKVEAGGVAEWVLYVKNNQVRTDFFQISADDLSIAPFSDVVKDIKVSPSQIEINPSAEKEIRVNISLLEDLVADKEYISYIWVKSLTNPSIKEKVGLSNFIISSRELIGVKVDLPRDGVVPGINMPFDITFKNRGNKPFTNLDIYVASSVFNDQKKLSLDAYESLKTGFNFNIDSTTMPGRYSMSVRVFQGDSLKGIENVEFRVVENPNVVENDITEKTFLKTVQILQRENKGNKEIEARVRYEIGLLRRLFSSVDPNPKVMKFDGVKYYVWDIKLEPGQKANMTITTNYRIILALLLLIGIGVIVFYYFKGKTITVTKSLFRIRDERENVTELKILLHVVNNTDTEVHNIKVIDILPNLIKPTPDFATLKPERIQKGAKGMRMIWNIPKLEINEERVISYRVQSTLSLVGEVELPSAFIQYKGRGHKLISVKSNKLSFVAKK